VPEHFGFVEGEVALTPGPFPKALGEETLTPGPSPKALGEETLTPIPSPKALGEGRRMLVGMGSDKGGNLSEDLFCAVEYLVIGKAQNGKAMFAQDFLPQTVAFLLSGFAMQGAIYLNDQAGIVTEKVSDELSNGVLTTEFPA
jgi:hypothetical protein